ncbi:kinase-like domain-containing protein [Aspergillus keveii]|uniref:Altered inheritance of mitochondria protein 9, mitochondrial n=1 Tax=Aspergillus keveii TaxID=714993 RepID=A0ABR4FPI8_9EURO
MPRTVRCPIPGTLWERPMGMAFCSHYHPVFLRRDKLEVDARYMRFNFPALCRKVMELSPAASAITDCHKIEGGFNRVFIFTLDNGNRLVARFPFRFTGPAKLSTLSEVSTIRYLQQKTTIPIPNLVDWNHDAHHSKNPAGSEYMIMEHASGVPLIEKWDGMAGNEKVNCIRSVNKAMKEASDLQFPAKPLDTGFCFGPHCGTRCWDDDVRGAKYYQNVKPNHGPWRTICEFSDGLIDAGLSRVPPTDNVPDKQPAYHGSPEAHIALLKTARSVLKQMALDPQIQKYRKPLLFHPDLHKRNIFVSEDDPTVIAAIIDWQDNEILKQAFDLTSQYYTPQLAGPRLVDESLFRPFLYSYRTWRDGTVALRQELIETARLWHDLGLGGSCPYPSPSSGELAKHMKEYKLFEAAQELRVGMYSVINTGDGGWVPTDQWEAAHGANKELYHGALEAVLTNPDVDEDEPVQDEETLRSIWPFDLPQ